MRQPIKLLPCFSDAIKGAGGIARFKSLSVNCATIGESWELSDFPGYESIVAEGENAGMSLSGLLALHGEQLLGRRIHARYGNRMPVCVKLVDADDGVMVEVRHNGAPFNSGCDDSRISDFSPKVWRIPVPDGPMLDEEGKAGQESYCIVKSPCLTLVKKEVSGESFLTLVADSFIGVVCLQGEGCLRVDGVATEVAQGETLLLPASVEEVGVEGSMTLLTVNPS